ncbi:anti-anti-sigma factor [Andreprevotia lacus DSM 23236]|jgi:anti-anti-sigma factor|uniref:Anti-anti-sigma factor n=1 Tax=Andreprevotia lacus DSM 23236 TaxID=1121001 RepID=A0A1W1X2K4_9NEIS|nr:STAS domain-containing protein [Andreprevotia lacus]SMC18135.1 anti-anti-sigma factor [Andreprevotia lacus DSM 23236]
MPISEQTRDGHLLLQLEGGLTIFQAAELKDELLQALAHAEHRIELNLAAVEEIDSAGVQLLLALKHEAASQQKTVNYSHHSPPVLAAIDLLNLAATLGDPLLIPNAR